MKRSPLFLASFAALALPLIADDDFENATAIEFLTSEPTETVIGTNTGASAETFEPAHAGITASRSTWYSFTVDAPRRVELVAAPGAASPLSNLVVAVYTGTSLRDLEEVSRYGRTFKSASTRRRHPGGEPFTRNARLAFSAEPGITYYIAVDGESNAQGSYQLDFSTSRDTFNPEFELIPAESEWSYFQALTGTTASNPAIADADFYATWHTAANYDGPAFLGPRVAPFGYGAIIAEPARAFSLTTPATNNRQSVTYFRTTVTAERGIQGLGFEGIIDDGAIIYINGTEVARMNVNAGTSIYTTTAIAANHNIGGIAYSNEDFIQYATATGLDLPGGEEIEIGVSIHNASPTSSDSSFHMRIYATEADPLPALLTLENSGFADTYILGWEGRQGFSYQLEFTDTEFADEGWSNEGQEVITPEKDGEIRRFVLNEGPKGLWRVRSFRAAE
ncbi:MAG: hypothetical protein ABF379_07550 [Akkermansiaceae bacterium]